MKTALFFLVWAIAFWAVQVDVQAEKRSGPQVKTRHPLDYPEIPRVSAYEAYLKFKAGKAIIVHAGGFNYQLKHILASLDIDQESVRKGIIKLPRLPSRGVEIFTYCY